MAFIQPYWIFDGPPQRIVRDNKYFRLQEQLWFLGQYRIQARPNGWVIARANSLSEIEQDWRILEEQAVPELDRGTDVRHVLRTVFGRVAPAIAASSFTPPLSLSSLTGEEREQAEKKLAEQTAHEKERGAQIEAEYQREKKRERERVAKEVHDGRLCPRCEFGFAWDGIECGHCGYRLAQEGIGEKQLQQAARVAEGRARQESEQEADRQNQMAAEQARMAAAIREGKICPRCGFSYQWDGTNCGHCHYRSSAEADVHEKRV